MHVRYRKQDAMILTTQEVGRIIAKLCKCIKFLLLLPAQSHNCLGARHGMISFWAPIAYISWSITRCNFSRDRVSGGRMWNVPGEAPCSNRWFSISYNTTCQNATSAEINIIDQHTIANVDHHRGLELRH